MYIDVVTAMDFDKSGNYLGVGDYGGRIILFKKSQARKPDVRLGAKRKLDCFCF